MLTVLKNLWTMIVKALTLGTSKGNAYLDSKVSPLEKADQSIKRLQDKNKDNRHRYFKVNKNYEDSKKALEDEKQELAKVENEIKKLLADGNETRAKQKASLGFEKTRLIKHLESNVTKLETTITQIEHAVDKNKVDIEILKSKRKQLEAALLLRDNSKTQATGDEVDGIECTIDDILKEAEDELTNAEHEDIAWQATDKAFNENSRDVVDQNVEDYLSQFKS